MANYKSLGLNTFKYNQAALLVFSLLIIGINYILGSSLFFWFILILMLLFINLIWYSFSDVRWNKEEFVIEKFLKKKKIASNEFVRVDRLVFNVFVIQFTCAKYYFMGDFKSVFENSSQITNKIIADISESS
jgi:hypothetical protein